MTRPNSVTTNYAYDNLSRLTSVLHQLSGSTIDGATYTVDNAGNRTAKTDKQANVTSNYTYDALYQLTQVMQGTNTTESYSYDAVGNRTASLGVSSYTTNASNELTATSNASYTYDSNGNTLTKTVGSNTTTYAWDYENRLTSVTLPGSGGTVTFKYDPLGRRVEKASSSTASIYVYDGDNLTEETNSFGNVVARYEHMQSIDEPIATLRSSTTSFYNADGLGSITSLANGSGAMTQTYTYDSFGRQTAASGSLTNAFQYTGRELDTETGLYFNRARYYDPINGRFVSEDPIRSGGGINFYAYARNNSVLLADQMGLCPPHQCVAELRFRSVLGTTWNHAFWQVTDRQGQTLTIDGGPSGPFGEFLDDWIKPGTIGYYQEDNSWAALWFKAGPSFDICDQIDMLVSKAKAWRNDTFDYILFGFNSNSFARIVGNAGGFYPSQPPNTPAWGGGLP